MDTRRGFSLIELSIALVISGLAAGIYLQISDSSAPTECIAATRSKVEAINSAVERFARQNDRLPLPANRKIGVENVNYGHEAAAVAITQSLGVSFGAVPFQALGLPVEAASDCWGNKLTYMVTTALTTNAASGGYPDNNALGNIILKKDTTAAGIVNSNIAYAILSHGEDQLGAVKNNYKGATPNWCWGASTLKTMNCLATTAEVASGTFNNGKDAGTNYFDDIVIAAGKPSIAAALVPGNLYGWGANDVNQLADNTTINRDTPTPALTPLTFAQVAIGENHSCALTNTGRAYCWGENGSGELGTGSTDYKEAPASVQSTLTFTKITVGDSHTCAIQAITKLVWCWGYNGEGELGDGTGFYTDSEEPTPVSGGHLFTDISAGGTYTCGIEDVTNDAYCWGDNSYGQLGANLDPSTYPDSDIPVHAGGALAFTKIVTGTYHACAIATNNLAYCWGDNSYGKLGANLDPSIPANAERHIPVLVTDGTINPNFANIAIKADSTCGITPIGKTYCWGDNGSGQLGEDPFFKSEFYAAHHLASAPPFLPASLALGVSHTCALTGAGEAYCWGGNSYGELGDGMNLYQDVYTVTATEGKVAGGHNFTSITVGDNHTCGIDTGGAAYCWGYNDEGQIGNGTNGVGTEKDAPKPVSGGLTFNKIVAGGYHTFALTP